MIHLHGHRVQLSFAGIQFIDSAVGLHHLLGENLSDVQIPLFGGFLNLPCHFLLLPLYPPDLSVHATALLAQRLLPLPHLNTHTSIHGASVDYRRYELSHLFFGVLFLEHNS